MSLELDFIELYNPLYLLPIVAVVFCAALVYAFGFKSPTQPPNFSQIDEQKTPPKKRKANREANKLSSTAKSPQNGVINNALKISDKKSNINKIDNKSSISDKNVVSNNEVKKDVRTEKRTKPKKEAKTAEPQELEDKDSGGWVQLISKKERKNRRQKEEQLLKEKKG